MLITDIIEIDKKRDKIYIDNEFAFVLYKGELHLYNIKIGNVLTEAIYNQIINEVIIKRVRLRAMNLLTKKDYTEAQLRKKLLDGYYKDEIVDKALEYVKSYGYIDDERYVKSYFSIHILSKPRKLIEQKLIEKGISTKLLEEIVDDIYEEERFLTKVPDELEMGRNLLDKKKYDIVNSPSDRQKAYGYLLRRGISSESAIKLLKEYQKA